MPELLTAQLINSLAPKNSRYVVSDTKMPGLAVMVYPSGSKSFLYRYRAPKCRTVKSAPLGQTTKLSVKAARAAAKNMAGDVSRNIDPQQNRKKLAEREQKSKNNNDLELFNYIEKYYEPYAKRNSETAIEIIKALKSNFSFIKSKPINKIDNLDIEKWRKTLVHKNLTFERIQRIYTYLKACINTAIKHYKLIDSFELQHYTLKRQRSEKVNPPKLRYLLKEEETRLIAALNNRDKQLREKRTRYVEWQSARNHTRKKLELFAENDYPDYISPIIIIAYQTGFDLGDIFDFDWQEHIDFNSKQILRVRNKTKHKQNNPQPVVIPMTDKVQAVLTQWGNQHGKTGRIFNSTVTGGRLDNITKAWGAVKKEAELENFRFKDLRHTFGSWLAMAGVDLLDIRDLMGHKDIKTTQIYAHLCPKKKKEAVIAVFS